VTALKSSAVLTLYKMAFAQNTANWCQFLVLSLKFWHNAPNCLIGFGVKDVSIMISNDIAGIKHYV
jgi:hypothetical protein